MVGIIILIYVFYLETDAIANCAKKYSGSYTGTLEYGIEHPTTFTFASRPNVLLVYGIKPSRYPEDPIRMKYINDRELNLIPVAYLTTSYVEIYSNGVTVYAKYDSNTVYLYGDDPDKQHNSSSWIYYWTAW